MVQLSADLSKKQLRDFTMGKLLQVIEQPDKYRSHPRRYAVQSIAQLAYQDQEAVVPSITLLTQESNEM